MLKTLIYYPLTRPVDLGICFNVTILLLGIFWVIFITLINVAAVGYELVPITSANFNASYTLWYERFTRGTSWIPRTWNCDPSMIKLGEPISTNKTSFFDYTLQTYNDTRRNSPVDGMTYEDTLVTECLIDHIYLTQFASSPFKDEGVLTCKTSAGQTFSLSTSREASFKSVKVGSQQNYGIQLLSATSPQPLNITEVLEEWNTIFWLVLDIIAPYEQMSIFQSSLVAYNLSSIRFAYYACAAPSSCLANLIVDSIGVPNTPANDHWAIQFAYTPLGDWQEKSFLISFLPMGEIDWSRTTKAHLDTANTILAPSINQLQILTGSKDSFDFWKFISWIVISNHWLLLYDFGQVAPTYSDIDLISYNLPQNFTSTNNIFINNTLFENFTAYLEEVPLQILNNNLNGPPLSNPQFSALDDHNSLQPFETTILRSYSCVERRLKGWVSAAISVLAADYAFIMGGYSVLVLLIGTWLKHIDKDANSCEKCVDGTKTANWGETKYRKVGSESTVSETYNNYS